MSDPPERIGPYRIEDKLGSGGMGEVYRAYDERLDRWVAIKLIRPEIAGHEKARVRFQGEARAAAGLNHPAVVQIHDVPLWNAIVMELVEGPTVASLLRDGPLELARALRLAQRIAEGMIAAHAKEIVHRDLKTENVIVTPAGDAKILDFGLAKRFRQRDNADASLSLTDGVVGTFRAMSPEQAQGKRVDHRSDLFSFGTLLYEMLTGQSPFMGESAFDIMTKICTAQQTPVRKLNPEVPEPLSALVDHLLKKDPACRPQSAQEVAAELERIARMPAADSPSAEESNLDGGPTVVDGPRGIPPARPSSQAKARPLRRKRFAVRVRRWALPLAGVLVLAAVLLMLWPWLRPRQLYVAVLKPEITAGRGDERVELLTFALREAIIWGLRSRKGIVPRPKADVDHVSGSPAQVARAVVAAEAVAVQLACNPKICKITLRRIRGSDDKMLGEQRFEFSIDRLDLLDQTVEQQLRSAYRDYRVAQQAPREVPTAADYVEYLRLRTRFEASEEENLSVDQLLARLREIRGRWPDFLEAIIFEADLLRYRYFERRVPADRQQALNLLRKAAKQASADPELLLAYFDVALTANELDEAETILDELEQLQPEQLVVKAQRARLLDKSEDKEDREDAIQLMRDVVEQRPSMDNLFWLVDMAMQRGEQDEARQLQDLLERFPNRSAMSKLAQVELTNGRPARAAEIYEELVRRSPQVTELANLGVAYLLLERYEEAEKKLRQAQNLAPKNPDVILNLADAVALQERKGEAEDLYKYVLALTQNADDTGAQRWTIRAQALAHLGKDREAVAAVQEALALGRDNPQVSLEVSLVYTVIGDNKSALYNAGQALEKGIAPGWFKFPWFDPLYTLPQFQELLKQHEGSDSQQAVGALGAGSLGAAY